MSPIMPSDLAINAYHYRVFDMYIYTQFTADQLIKLPLCVCRKEAVWRSEVPSIRNVMH